MKKQLKSVNAILFDLDDTLIDSFNARAAALGAVFTKAGITGYEAARILQEYRGLEIKDILVRCGTGEAGLDDLFYQYRKSYWTGETSRIELFPGIKEMLEEMVDHGLKLGVVTQKGHDFNFDGIAAGAVVELKKAGILEKFSIIIGSEDVSNLKPHPEGIQKAMAELKARPENTLFVGDSMTDMQATRSANCLSCWAKWGLPQLYSLEADFIAETPQELQAMLFSS